MKTLLILWKAFDYSLQGAKNTFYDEIAFRIELAVAVSLIPAALLLAVSLIVRILLIGSVLLVLIIELLNTGVEAALNRINTEKHTHPHTHTQTHHAQNTCIHNAQQKHDRSGEAVILQTIKGEGGPP